MSKSGVRALLTIGAVLLASSSSAPATQGAGVDGRPVPPPGKVALTWSPAYMSDDHEYTRSEARAVARRFDLVVAMPVAFGSHSDAMREVNPTLTLLSYANGMIMGYEKTRKLGLPERAFAHDRFGKRIRMPSFGSFLMESSSRAWRETADKECRSRVKKGGYDGCLVDNLTLGLFSSGSTSGIPAKPGTREEYTQEEYRTNVIETIKYFRRESPGLIHIGNSVGNVYQYWTAPVSSRPIAISLPGAQMEDFLRSAAWSVNEFPQGQKWRDNVRIIDDLETAGVVGFFTTKLWSKATNSQVAQWQRFSMASFLMAANGLSYFAFIRSRDQAGATGTNAPYEMPNVRGPAGDMQKHSSGGFYRLFANGAAIVNPRSEPATFTFALPMRRLNGNTVTSVTLGPNDGDVLVGTPGIVDVSVLSLGLFSGGA